ncbi:MULTISPECIES: sulfatase [unclassified Oceanispirochaeta]|uniref:sulfatase n=1 Tax=unclassified Oceanispirochaeta TaxID=2635722 RepID=UPI000E092ACB|nr:MULTISPECIES: sulfatase [unclassified Oceanispirochaeta]MBF9018373.1 sulfatase [Oceanispirochaeta sp. M2]NPD74823.1 sulfatase [Oceanispirochaeta sp. M1]RDG29316.1 sulfatase [Oceanispirochaeta sp. M1]
MKAVMVMFDSLNRDMLSSYGCDWTLTPNFKRLSENTITFTNSFAGSLPCMPARRELHTGRYNFLHRCWGPVEPFDDSMPSILKENGVYTHLVSDHAHYWEDGGASYHTRYNSWESFRGQEGDYWKGEIADPEIPEDAIGRMKHSWRQDWVNRKYMPAEEDMPLYKSFEAGMEFIEKNKESDNWFLQLETFDPHEPFFVPDDYAALYDDDYKGPHFDWPAYQEAENYTDEQIVHVRKRYAALLSMCDAYLGKVMDMMDENNMWNDTMLIVNTDHGFLLGEHGWFGKNRMPTYTEIARTPFFVWDPRTAEKNKENHNLVQTIDIAPTLLDFFNIEIPGDMQGCSLERVIRNDESVREGALFGLHGGHINYTDGRYVYMRAPVSADDKNLFNYTLLPTHINSLFSPEELSDMTLEKPLSFSKGCQVLKIRALKPSHNTYQHTLGDYLFDLANDPEQKKPITDPDLVTSMKEKMSLLMKEADAPNETYIRYGLMKPE